MKISNHIKEKIVRQVELKKIKPLEDSLKEKLKTQLKNYIESETKEHSRFIKLAPEGWLYKKDYFRVQFGDSYSECFHITLSEPVIVPFSWSQGYRELQIIIKKLEWKKIFSELKKEEMQNEKYKNELLTELKGFLSGINTDKQLIENFPEVQEFININEFKFHAPVVQPEKLKKLLKEV